MIPLYECPKFDLCSVNKCVLDLNYPNLYIDKTDTERICKLNKNKRIIIASRYPGLLKYQGLTKKEFAGKMRWEKMEPETKDKILSTIKKYNFECRNSEGEKKVI